MNTPSLSVQPEGRHASSALHDALVQSVALLLVVVLALSSLGPMLDHHFAERHPGHHHLFLGAGAAQHSHIYGQAHAHTGDWMYAQSGRASGNSARGAISFAPNDGAGAGGADLSMLFAAPQPRYGDGNAPVLQSPADAGVILAGISVAPSRRPPRA